MIWVDAPSVIARVPYNHSTNLFNYKTVELTVNEAVLKPPYTAIAELEVSIVVTYPAVVDTVRCVCFHNVEFVASG